MNTQNLSTLKIHKMTDDQYKRERAAGRIDDTAMYLTPDEEIDLSNYVTNEKLEEKVKSLDATDISGLAKVASSGDYNDLLNVPTNTGYTHPETHPASMITGLGTLATKSSVSKSDMDSSVQTSLGKADTALQSYTETDPTVPAWAKAANKPSYTASEVGAEASGAVNTHNVATDTHNDIRLLIEGLTTRLNTLADSDDITLDQMSEVVSYIKSNKSLIEEITTNKVNVTDIINNLTTNVTNKPLSAAQGVALKTLIDTLQGEVNKKALASDLTSHINNKNNPHGFTLSQLGVTVTATELNYTSGVKSNIQTQLDKKADDYCIEIYNGTSGNPKPVRFMTVDYSTCGSENGVAIKLGMVSGHGNGTSYAFLQDAIIKVGHTGTVEVDNFKYYGASCGTYDGAARQYGDIFWTIDTTNKVVDFYVLMGQYARIQMTPWKRVTYSTGGTITQHTSCTVYSSGDKVWGNNSDIALMSDLNSLDTRLSALESSIVTVHSGTAAPVSELGEDGDIYFVTG